MIAFLRGRPAGTGSDSVIIDVGGVGYRVFVPTSALGQFIDGESDITVFTYMHVREDVMQLFGFCQEKDLEVFELLIQISGIGPRLALAVLSAMPAESFVQAVIHEQLHVITQIPGVGKKTAQRVIIELKDKFSKMTLERSPVQSDKGADLPDAASDALQALAALGYNQAEAKRVLAKLTLDSTMQTGEIVRLALKELGRF